MKASTKENLKLTWAVICVAISVIAGMVYWHYFQPGDGASMKHAWNA